MSKTREQFAGEKYNTGRDVVSRGVEHELWMVASHIYVMLEGTKEFPGPLWPVRDVPPEGRRITLDSFEDYLLKPAREGLGFKSLVQVDLVLRSAEREGKRALAALLKAVPDWHEKVKTDIDKAVPVLTTHGTNQHGGGDNVTSTPDRGNSETYTLARLKRDNPDLAARVVNGELSAHKAAIQAGFRRPMIQVPADDYLAAMKKINDHYNPFGK